MASEMALAARQPKAAEPAVEVLPAAPVIPPAAQQKFAQALQALQAGQVEQASQLLQDVANGYPTYAAPLINLGLIEQRANRHAAAVEHFQRALERDPYSAPALANLGISYRQLGQLKDAEAAYKGALSTDAGYALAHLNLGILYDLYLQKPTLALQSYESYQSLQAAPDTKVAAWIKDLRGRAQGNAGGQP